MTRQGFSARILASASRRSAAFRKSQLRPSASPCKSKVKPLPSDMLGRMSFVTRGTEKSSLTFAWPSAAVAPLTSSSSYRRAASSLSCSEAWADRKSIMRSSSLQSSATVVAVPGFAGPAGSAAASAPGPLDACRARSRWAKLCHSASSS
jgi:hypothetical protein